MSGTSRKRARGDEPLLAEEGTTAATNDELLDQFVRRHPMLSLSSCSASTLEIVHKAMQTCAPSTACIETVNKAHDDLYLRPANTNIGERPCVLDQDCLAVFLARMRYGPSTDRSFVCREYLLPAEAIKFESGRGLPSTRKKCLICHRYYISYLYTVMRTDPSFRTEAGLCTLPRQDGECSERLRSPITSVAETAHVASEVNCPGGYNSSALIGYDEDLAKCNAVHSSPLSAILLRPTVRFVSSHYSYQKNLSTGQWEIIQVGVDCNTQNRHPFQQPPSQARDPMAA